MRYIKFKDLFTIINLFLAFYVLILLFNDQFSLASYILLVNILVVDLLDGFVARLTKTFNTFGKYLDTVTDFVSSSLVIPFFIYFIYRDLNYYLAVMIAFLPLLVGVLRQVQSQVEEVSYPTYFIGLPRNIGGLMILTYLNSSFLYEWKLYGLGIIVICVICFLQMTHIPFLGNDKGKEWIPRIRYYLYAGALIMIIFIGLGLLWDGAFIMLFCYVIAPFIIVDRAVWNDIQKQGFFRK